MPSLVDIDTATVRLGNHNIIGVVVDVFRGVWKTKGSASVITFTLKDSNLDNGHTWDGLRVKYFRINESQLPPVQVGDIVLLRNIWIRALQGKVLGSAGQDKDVPWAIFRHDPDPTSTGVPLTGPEPFEPTYEERSRALSLLDRGSKVDTFRDGSLKASRMAAFRSHQSHTVVSAAVEQPKAYKHKDFSLIKDVEERMYTDVVCEVIRLYLNDSDKVLLYVSDYTAHDSLPDYGYNDDGGREGDEFNYQGRSKKWMGPSKMTVQVTLWEPHASFGRNCLQQNDLVLLSNVHFKQSRVHERNLEASIHGSKSGSHDPVKVRIVDESDSRVRELLRRKEEYFAHNSDKRKLEGEPEQSKSAKKRNKNKAKNQAPKMEENQQTLSTSARSLLNPSIQAANPAVQCKSIEYILSNESHENTSPDGIQYRFPFQNLSYRSNVKVVDFFPPNLEDFAVLEEPDDDDDDPDSSSPGPRTDSYRWEWRFCLLVESAQPPPKGQPKERMKLFVTGAFADYLLQIDAVNLRENKPALHELREKLFILWGNLEERKQSPIKDQSTQKVDPLSSRPFTCCIQEFGIPCSHTEPAAPASLVKEVGCMHEGCFGWERRFGMFMTTIHS